MKPGAREAVFAAVLLAIGLGVWSKVLVPRSEAVAAMDEQRITGAKGLREVDASILVAEESLQTDLRSLNTAVVEAAQRVPNDPAIEEVMDTLQDLTKKHGLVTENLYPLRQVPPSMEGMLTGLPYQQHWLELEMCGTADSLYEFLRDVESLPRSVRIPEMTVTHAAASEPGRRRTKSGSLMTPDQQKTLRARLKLQVFSRTGQED